MDVIDVDGRITNIMVKYMLHKYMFTMHCMQPITCLPAPPLSHGCVPSNVSVAASSCSEFEIWGGEDDSEDE
jgi:hypothetical protein